MAMDPSLWADLLPELLVRILVGGLRCPPSSVFRLGDHSMRVGEYLTIHEADGDDLTYKITEVQPV